MMEKLELNKKEIEDNSGLEEKWSREFEEDYSELKSSNPQKYERLKEKFISEKSQSLNSGNLAEEMAALNVRQEQKLGQKDRELDDLWGQFEWLNSKHEDVISEYKKALIESTTGLKRRENLYKEMDKNIEGLLGVAGLKKKSDQEVLELLISAGSKAYKQAKLSVMLGDMAYLSLANESGHREGDKLLERVGKAIKEELPDASRHGGDEFTALVLLNFKETEKKVKYLETGIKKLKKLPILERYDLELSMDIGTAHIGEAFSVFKETIGKMKQSAAGREKLEKIDVLKEFEDIWLEIADKRSFIKKGKERIKLLIKKKTDENKPREYGELVGSLRKGGYNIKDEELQNLINKITIGENREQVIFNYIKGKEMEFLRNLPPDRRGRAEAILRTAEPDFLK